MARICVVHHRPLHQPTRISRWMVVLTFWLFALAPAISQAMQAGSGAAAGWASVCTSNGGNSAPQPDAAQHLFEHCPLCALHAQDLAPPPDAAAPSLRQDLGQAMPARFLSAAAPLHAWAPSQARAPPIAR